MREQQTGFNCGPASLQNALRALGHPIGQKRVARLCGTDEEGTDERELCTGLDALGCSYELYEESDRQGARHWLAYNLEMGHPVIMLVDNWSHWLTCIGLLGKRVVVFDPARFDHLVREHHVWMPTIGRLMKSWQGHRRKEGETHALFTAIAVRKYGRK